MQTKLTYTLNSLSQLSSSFIEVPIISLELGKILPIKLNTSACMQPIYIRFEANFLFPTLYIYPPYNGMLKVLLRFIIISVQAKKKNELLAIILILNLSETLLYISLKKRK